MSDLFFKCPGCATQIEAPDDLAGAAVNCPECDRILRVPGEARTREEFVFACPSCGQSIDVPVDAAGLHLPCPGCGVKIDVPEPPAPPEPVAAVPQFSADAEVAEEEKKGSTARIDLPAGDSAPPPQMRTVLIKRSHGVQKGEIPLVPVSPAGDGEPPPRARKGGLFGWMRR